MDVPTARHVGRSSIFFGAGTGLWLSAGTTRKMSGALSEAQKKKTSRPRGAVPIPHLVSFFVETVRELKQTSGWSQKETALGYIYLYSCPEASDSMWTG